MALVLNTKMTLKIHKCNLLFSDSLFSILNPEKFHRIYLKIMPNKLQQVCFCVTLLFLTRIVTDVTCCARFLKASQQPILVSLI